MASTPSQQHNSMPLLWHSRSEFWELFDNEYGAQQRQLAQYFHLPLALSAIRARIAQPLCVLCAFSVFSVVSPYRALLFTTEGTKAVTEGTMIPDGIEE